MVFGVDLISARFAPQLDSSESWHLEISYELVCHLSIKCVNDLNEEFNKHGDDDDDGCLPKLNGRPGDVIDPICHYL